MATATLRPDGVLSTSTPAPSNNGGAASLNAAVADNLDTTFVRFLDTGAYWMVEYSLGSTVVPGDTQVRSVMPRIRHNNAWSAAATPDRAFTLGTGGAYFPDEPIVWLGAVNPGSTDFRVQWGAERTAQPNGAPWTGAALDALTLRIFFRVNPNSYYWAFDVAEVYVDVVLNRAPYVTGTALGTVGTSRPTFSWTYTDPEGDPQERFRVKVFSAAQYGATGFDPNTATPAVDSGEVYSSATSWASPVDLLDGTTYRAFVVVADAGSNGHYSTIGATGPYSSATISLVAPTAPTITATTDPANARVTLAIASANNINPAATYRYSVERSDDGGTTWKVLERLWVPASSTVDYRSVDFATTAAPALTAYDYEAVRGTVPRYRVQVKATMSGNNLQSPYSPTATATAALTGAGWVLRPVLAPAQAAVLHVHSESVTWQSEERQSALYPLGRARAIVLSDVVGGERLDIELAMLSEAEYATFEAIRARMDVLLLQSSYGDHRYVRIGSARSATHVLNGGGPRKYVVKASFIEVDP
jgi:hypothetical protein